MARQVATIEIGSSKVICLVAGKNNNELVVSGAGVCGYSGGYRYDPYKGVELPDEKELADAMRRAVHQAEYEAGKIQSAVIAIGAPFLRVLVMRGEYSVKGKHRVIVEEDEENLGAISLKNTNQPGYLYIHSTAIAYYVDGEESVNLPIGKRAESSIAAEISHVYVDKRMADLSERVLNSLGIEKEAFVATPLAETHYLIPTKDAGKTTLLVDVGYMHTDIACVKNETILDLESVPMGGKHFASDVAQITEISLSNAESIKRRYKFGLDYTGTTEAVKNADGVVEYIDKDLCSRIIEARMDELCDCITDYVYDLNLDTDNLDVYLTGGGVLMMQEGAKYMSEKTGLHIVSEMPVISRKQLNTPNHASAFAVAAFVLNSELGGGTKLPDEPKKSMWKKIFKK